ncbi:MAG: hypothetical protein DCC67_10595 [Planctomycetota bacterium]|nr:MAG: hypothetical protein DCC67_10595 [Planctomycetota bacterium]
MAIAAVAIAGGYGGARALAPRIHSLASPPADVASVPRVSESVHLPDNAAKLPHADAGDGDRLMQTVVEALDMRPNIAARVRQSLRLETEWLSAEGKYWQRSVGNGRRTRWEVTTKVDDLTAHVTQVFNGDDVWTDRKTGAARKISRVDVGRIKRELGQRAAPGDDGAGGASDPALERLVRGGLPQLVAELGRSFTFAPPQTMRRGDQVVLAVIGVWRPERLARHWPSAGAGDWPAHLPHHVLVHVDSEDYFPYYIEYRAGDQQDARSSPTAHFPVRDPLSSIEFIDVRFDAPMDEQLFDFAPGDAGFQDATGRLLDQLRSEGPPPASELAAQRPAVWQ